MEKANTVLMRKQKKRKWLVLSSVAAACAIVAAASVFLLIQSQKPTYFQQIDDFDFSNLPILAINENNDGGMGFEGYIAYSISDLENGNPWSERDSIIALPVFANPHNEISTDEMIKRAKETAENMGWAIDGIHTEPTEEKQRAYRDKINSLPEDMKDSQSISFDDKPYMAVAKCGDYMVEAHLDGDIRINFGDKYIAGQKNGFPLPDKYSFTYHDTTEKQAKETMQYLLKQYMPFVNMKSPALNLFGDYNIYAQRTFSYAAYEGGGDLIDKILGYNFNYVNFAPNDDGNLYLITRYKADLSEKIGDYPIITAKEAREMLLQNHYITTTPLDTIHCAGEFIDENYISAVELVYRTAKWEEVFMPYYKFYIELTGFAALEELNLKNFGIFYVPAVKEEYLANIPIWDGRFN